MLYRLFKKIFTYETLIILIFIAIYIICRFFDITCLIYRFTKIPCPTCFMGRALCSAFMGDFRGYVSYNIMAIPLALAFVAELYSAYFKKIRKMLHCYVIFVLIVNMIYYLIRLYIFLRVF